MRHQRNVFTLTIHSSSRDTQEGHVKATTDLKLQTFGFQEIASSILDTQPTMDIPSFIRHSAAVEIKTFEMHTTGEPTRIVYSGFPDLPYASTLFNSCQR